MCILPREFPVLPGELHVHEAVVVRVDPVHQLLLLLLPSEFTIIIVDLMNHLPLFEDFLPSSYLTGSHCKILDWTLVGSFPLRHV